MSLFDREPVEAIGRDYVASHPEVLELIRKAAERRYVAYPISTSPNTELERINAERRGTEIESASGAESDEEDVYDDALIGILLGNIGEMRVFAHLLEVDARVALEEHDTQRFVRNIEAMIGIAEQFGREKFVISYLVGRVIAEDASEIVRRALAASPNAFDEAQLRRMQRAMETTEGARSPVDMSVERLFFEDIVQRIYTDDGSGNGRVTRAGMRTYKDLADIDGGEGLLADPTLQFLAAPASLVVTADRAELMEKFDEIMLKIEAHMRTPLWEEPIEHPDMVVERIHEEQRYKYPLITTFLPALSRLRMRGAIADQHLDSAVLALALERYRLGHGSYPERLDARELGVPATSMIDQMTGNTLRYIVTPDGQGYTLYSFGNDLDDDGGVSVQGGGSSIHTRYSPEILAQMDKERLAELDGDWVLFPLPAAVPSAAE